MIRLHRNIITKPVHFDKDKVQTENMNALALYDKNRDTEEGIDELRKKFKFKQYRDNEVKEALKIICNNKCAYCESSFLHVYYGDIEHFRPKKLISNPGQNDIKPGYYWLSNEWENLLLSCLFCNQSKGQLVPQLENGQITLKKLSIGKQNQFPLSDDQLFRKRRDHTSWPTIFTKDEKERLLLNPFTEDPEKHLQYTEEGVIQAKKLRGQSGVSPRGTASIEVYALQRIYLVQERKKRIIEVQSQINQVMEAILKLDEFSAAGNQVVVTHYQEKIDAETRRLFYYTHPRQAYSGMCRQFVYHFLKKKLKMKMALIRALEEEEHAKETVRRSEDPFQI